MIRQLYFLLFVLDVLVFLADSKLVKSHKITCRNSNYEKKEINCDCFPDSGTGKGLLTPLCKDPENKKVEICDCKNEDTYFSCNINEMSRRKRKQFLGECLGVEKEGNNAIKIACFKYGRQDAVVDLNEGKHDTVLVSQILTTCAPGQRQNHYQKCATEFD